MESKAITAIHELNADYKKLSSAESALTDELKKLQADEELLQTALAQSKETGREKMAREKRKNDDDVLKNLQAALMADDDDSSSSDEEQQPANNGGVGFGGIDDSSDELINEDDLLQVHHL